jgi:hypothetical protein
MAPVRLAEPHERDDDFEACFVVIREKFGECKTKMMGGDTTGKEMLRSCMESRDRLSDLVYFRRRAAHLLKIGVAVLERTPFDSGPYGDFKSAILDLFKEKISRIEEICESDRGLIEECNPCYQKSILPTFAQPLKEAFASTRVSLAERRLERADNIGRFALNQDRVKDYLRRLDLLMEATHNSKLGSIQVTKARSFIETDPTLEDLMRRVTEVQKRSEECQKHLGETVEQTAIESKDHLDEEVIRALLYTEVKRPPPVV